MRSGVKQERKEGGGCLVGQIGHHRQTCAGPEPVLRGSGSNAPICGPGAISHVATLYLRMRARPSNGDAIEKLSLAPPRTHPMTRWKSRYLTSVGKNHMGSGSTPKTSTQGTGAKLPFGPRLRMRSIVPIPVTIAYTWLYIMVLTKSSVAIATAMSAHAMPDAAPLLGLGPWTYMQIRSVSEYMHSTMV